MERRVVQIRFVAGIQDEQPRNGSANESGNETSEHKISWLSQERFDDSKNEDR